MYGSEVGDIPCLTLVDSKDLYESIHNIKSPQDRRLIGDILQIKQAIAIDKIITEVRHVRSDDMLADPLTKGGVNAEELLNVLRCGTIKVPGDTSVTSSMKINTSTWQKLIQAQSEDFH